MGEINDRQLQRLKKQNYWQGDLLGKYGIERTQEKFLRGKSGFKQVEVDAYGRELRVVRPFVEKPGNNVHLTIDLELQKKAEELFARHEGSVVVLDPSDGAILALVSKPSFNPNIFAGGIDAKNMGNPLERPSETAREPGHARPIPPGLDFQNPDGFRHPERENHRLQ